MRQLTVTIPKEFYKTFINFIKHIPDSTIEKNIIFENIIDNSIMDEIPVWQQKKAIENLKKIKPKDHLLSENAIK